MTGSDPPNCQKYGVPLYGASWVPLNAIGSADAKSGDTESENAKSGDTNSDDARLENVKSGDKKSEDVKSGDGEGSSSAPPPSNQLHYLVFAGGGGEGRCGIPNEILLAEFDFSADSLSDHPVVRLGTGDELPYRMAVHPGGEGLICSLPKRCRWFDWHESNGNKNGKLCLKSSDKVLTQLEDVGQQLAVAFSGDGSLLAIGGEDGKLRVFKWPSLEILLNEKAYSAVKDLHFSLDGKYVASVGTGGPCRIWDSTKAKVVASLSKKNDEVFGFCRFSHRNGDQILYTTVMHSKGGNIVSWNTRSWKRVASKQVTRDPVSAFNVSADGKFLAIGTIQGDILILDSSMRVQMSVKKAHLGLVTALTFSPDSRALASASMDSSARVTLVQEKAETANGFNYWVIVFIIILAVAVYFLKTQGMIPEGLPFH